MGKQKLTYCEHNHWHFDMTSFELLEHFPKIVKDLKTEDTEALPTVNDLNYILWKP